MRKWVEQRWLKLVWNMLSVCLLTVILAACGGGGGGGSSDNKVNNPSDNQPTAVILSGTAAIGAPMSGGSVWLREADRTEHGPYPIDATGNYFIDVTGFTPPFHIKACSADGTTCLYSIATQEQHIANINPLTSWVVMKAAGVNDPADVFDNPALYSITEQELNDAINEIELELAGLFTKFNITQNFLSDTYIANASDNLDGLFDENLNIDFDFIAGKVSFTLNGKYLGCDYIDDAKNQDDPIEGAEIEDALATASVSGLGYNYPPIYQASLSVNTSNNSLSYVDFESRQRFDSTSMAVDVDGGPATITGNCTATDTITNTTTPGYSYTATITDGSPDAMGIVINDSAGDKVYSSNGAHAVVNGNYTVGVAVSGLGYNYPPIYQASLSVNTSNNSLRYVDSESRQRFDSTSMAVDVTGGTATITGSCTVTDTITNTTTPGYSYTATITDGSPDAMGIVINDSAGDEVYSSNGANDIVSGNFNVTP